MHIKCDGLVVRLLLTVALGFGVALTGLPQSFAQDASESVRRQLKDVETFLRGYGVTRTHFSKVDLLTRGERRTYNLRLDRGTTYMLVGVCDNDCRDVDIVVRDENGNNIGQDLRVSDLSVVTVSPRWTGDFSISVTVHHCTTRACFAGVGAFGS